MGGDDLGSDDDDFLNANIVAGSPAAPDSDPFGTGTMVEAESDDSSDDDDQGVPTSRKRKQQAGEKDVTESSASASTKNKKNKSNNASINSSSDPTSILLAAAKDLEDQDATQQSLFLNTALRHHKLLAASSSLENNKATTSSGVDIAVTSVIQPQHLYSAASVTEGGSTTLLERMKGAGVSLKKLKNWKHPSSPCVLIVCISARRAVEILKELSSDVKVRIAKLFPKNGSVQEQQQQLISTNFSIAVGTPHRLHVLMSTTKGKSPAALHLKRTQLLVFDCHVTQKQYTVCTLPDTSTHCMNIIHDFAVPVLQKQDKEEAKQKAKGRNNVNNSSNLRIAFC